MISAAGMGVLLAISASALVMADSPNETPTPTNSTIESKRWTPITSHSRLFVVRDMPPRDALEIAIWAESVREKLSAWIGESSPGSEGFPLIISAEIRNNEEGGRVIVSQEINNDGYLRQELIMINPAVVDQEVVLEKLCGLLIERWLYFQNRPPPQPDYSSRTPDWLAAGVARNLYAELREQDARLLDQLNEGGRLVRASSFFEDSTTSGSSQLDRPLAAHVLAWIADVVGRQKFMDAMASLLSEKESVSLADLFPLIEVKDEREFNMAWDVWRAEQTRRLIPGQWSTDTERLERFLELRPEDFGLVHHAPLPDGRLTPDALIADRREMWVDSFAGLMIIKLSELIPAQSPELAGVTKSFIQFFEKLGTSSGEREALSDKDLRLLWSVAGSDLAQFKSARDARDELISAAAMEPTHAGTNDADALEYLLDWWERRLDRPRTN